MLGSLLLDLWGNLHSFVQVQGICESPKTDRPSSIERCTEMVISKTHSVPLHFTKDDHSASFLDTDKFILLKYNSLRWRCAKQMTSLASSA